MGSEEYGAGVGVDLTRLTARSIKSLRAAAVGDGRGDDPATMAKLENLMAILEMERDKIQVFKRELPLSIRIVCEVIEGLKGELRLCRFGGGSRKYSGEEKHEMEKEEEEEEDKMNWMSTAQLWFNPNGKINPAKENDSVNCNVRVRKDSTKHRTSQPFVSGVAPTPVQEMSLLSPTAYPVTSLDPQRSACGSDATPVAAIMSADLSLQHQMQKEQKEQGRKPRRCWSQDLHRQFLAALRQLGGAEVATPKQIRELMVVDGLTNDEVKSHLQKYRLHTRRMPVDSDMPSEQLMMIGKCWSSRENPFATERNNSESCSPQGPFQLSGSGNAPSTAVEDSYEEDRKSVSCNWK